MVLLDSTDSKRGDIVMVAVAAVVVKVVVAIVIEVVEVGVVSWALEVFALR